MSASRGSRRALLLGFGSGIGLYVVTGIVTLSVGHRIVEGTSRITDQLATNTSLVSRMDHDVAFERILLSDHVFEKDIVEMARVEQQLDRQQADFQAAAQAYDRMPKPPAVERTWQDLQNAAAGMAGPIEHILTLSRANRDAEAAAAIKALHGQFSEVDDAATTLAQESRVQAAVERREVYARLHLGLIIAGVLATIATALFALLSGYVMQLVRAREVELDRQMRRLEELNRDLDAFAGRVAHDLRGPLTTIGLATARLKQSGRGDSLGALLSRSVARMEMLIRDLLSLSRVGAQLGGKSDPALVAEQIREEIAPRMQAEHGVLRVDTEAAEVRCPEGLLRQVLWNLSDNALKYRRPGADPEVRISGRRAREVHELRVSDNGIGMEPDEARHAGEPFYRSPRVLDSAGTGLGLSIVKRIVDAVRGTLAIDSRLGVGTTFVIRLPLAGTE